MNIPVLLLNRLRPGKLNINLPVGNPGQPRPKRGKQTLTIERFCNAIAKR